ncbi:MULTISPECIES: hypothetical protein [unclassified Rhizobium]
MIASNRFAVAGDWSTPDSAFIDNTDTGKIKGGTGAVTTQGYKFRRYRFRTTWAPKAGKFAVANFANSIYGIRPSQFAMSVGRIEIRTTANVLVDTLKFAGVQGVTLAVGLTSTFSDPIVDLAANTDYFCDVYFAPAISGAYPIAAGYFLPGECSGSVSAAAYVANTQAALTSAFQDLIGSGFGPCMFVAKGCPAGTPVGFVFGDSIADFTAIAAYFATSRGDLGHIGVGVGDPSNGGSWNYGTSARFSSNMQTVYSEGLVTGSVSVVTGLQSLFASLGQAKPPFNFVIHEHGRNNIGNGITLASLQTMANSCYSKILAAWPGLPIFQTTTPPNTTAANNSMWTDETNQAPTIAENGDASILKQWNDAIMAGTLSASLKGGIDTAVVCRGSSHYANWKVPAYSTVLLDAVAAAFNFGTAGNTIRLQDAPAIGEVLCFEPGVTNVDSIGYEVKSVTANATAGFDVAITQCARASFADTTLTGAGTIKMAKAHAASTAVKAVSSIDGLHPAQPLQTAMGAQIAAAKPAISTAAAVYAAAP